MKRVRDIPKPPVRPVDAHKGTAGLVLVVAGSRGMAGAAALVGSAALRAGAGLVRIATADAALDTVAALAPCCTTAPLPDDGACLCAEAAEIVLALAEGQDAVALGPGLGRTPAVGSVVRAVLEGLEIPVVLDADGLNAIAADAAEVVARARNGLILTPHPGEAARLLGSSAQDVQADREAAAERLAGLGAVAVLKGAGTVVCDGERLYVNETGNPGMATAGAGDVLAGMMAAFLAAGMPMFEAAVLAVWAHGRAGDLAAERLGHLGLTAMDILACVPEALRV
ncbi:MAG TPA: NAD(P)H-hydrate dehydratase [Phycisphaerae bacterium]|nr:NAD(P)H-hydrate dehydratase [Phycisphaerae bacterium]HUX15515.1 NAD(P)H-hydrate dehydratase [Phycisphaerae bacterium]